MKTKRRDAYWVIRIFCSLLACAGPAAAETWTIPQGAESRESPRGNFPPFSATGDVVSQQIFSPSLFPILSTPGQLLQIDGIAFRLNSAGTFPFNASATFDRVEILLSSGNGPFTLDLAGNHGPNLQVVYDGPLNLAGSVPPGTTPSLFDLAIAFEDSFLYDRSNGSLILEIRKYAPGDLGAALGAAQVPGTTFFYRTDFLGTQTSGDIGLETRFNYQVVPEPGATALFLLGVAGAACQKIKISGFH